MKKYIYLDKHNFIKGNIFDKSTYEMDIIHLVLIEVRNDIKISFLIIIVQYCTELLRNAIKNEKYASNMTEIKRQYIFCMSIASTKYLRIFKLRRAS